jgi:hypothetical protein
LLHAAYIAKGGVCGFAEAARRHADHAGHQKIMPGMRRVTAPVPFGLVAGGGAVS